MNRTRLALLTALAGSLVIAACGGGGGGGAEPPPPPPPPTSDVPASATASPDAFVSWTSAQPKSETKEPLKVEGTLPPTSETEEPLPLT